MDQINTDPSVVTPEELNAEKELAKVVTDDELKEKVIADFGLNPDENGELIDKLVADKKANHEKLSAAIKQKITWREKVTAQKPPEDKGGTLKSEDVDNIVNQKLEERELNALDLPDEIKAEIKDLAKLKNISVGEASKLPYIQSKIGEVKKEERVINGTPKRIQIGTKTITIDPSKALNPNEFDLATEDGRKAWEEAKAERATYRKEHQS